MRVERLLRNRLLLQLLFTFCAALCVAALSVVLIREAVNNAERVVVGEAHRSVSAALAELKQQYHYRVAFDSSWQSLPAAARDVSLGGITRTALRSYPGVEGGFYEGGEFLGYAFPTHDTGLAKTDVPSAERKLIENVNRRSIQQKKFTEDVVHGRIDLLVIAAEPVGKGASVWAMKRLAGRGAPNAGRRELLLAILVLAALVSIGGTLGTGLALARGVAQIKQGLSMLEERFEFELPVRSDELGSISRAINRMAATRRKLEAELLREDRLRAAGRLAAGLAHEIRNPLNSIRLTVQLLERRAETKTIRREDLQTVRMEVDRLSGLLNELLDLQRARQPKAERQAIAPIVEHCVELIRHQAEMQGTVVRWMATDKNAQAVFDAQSLTQTLVNLLLNALEASEQGGTISLNVIREGATARVEVCDEGAGLDREQREHLFEPFYTTKVNGTGLGLAVSRELMRSQGGDVRFIESDKGACFSVEMPCESH